MEIMTQSFDPNKAVNWMLRSLRAANDAKLALILEVNPPVISKIRHRRMNIGPTILIKIHEMTGMAIGDIRRELGLVS